MVVAEKAQPPIPVQILLGLMGLAIIHGLAWLLINISFGLAMGVAIFGGFAVAFTLSYRDLLRVGPAILLGLLCAYLGGVCTLTYSVFQLLPLGAEAQLEDVSEAPQHASAGVLVISAKGQAKPQYLGEYTDRSGKYDDVYQVHPIVPQGWSTDQPIPLWKGDVSSPTTASHEAQSDSVAVVVFPRDLYEKAIADAEKQFGLKSAPTAPVIRWVPPKVVADRAALAHILAASAYFMWLLGGVALLLIARSRASKKKAD